MLREEFQQHRALPRVEIVDQLHQLGLHALLHPGDVGALDTDALLDAAQAFRLGQVQEDDGVASHEARLQRARVQAVDDPRVARQHLIQRAVEFLPRDACGVGPPPEEVQVRERQPRALVQAPREGALAAARTAHDNDPPADGRGRIRRQNRRS